MGKKKEEIFMKIPCRRMAWIKGFINGRVGNAALNAEQAVESGYIRQVQRLYEAFTTKQLLEWDKQRHELVAEAKKLLMELKQQQIFVEPEDAAKDATVIEQRAVRRKKKAVREAKANHKSRKTTMMERLVEIRTLLSEGECEINEKFLATEAEASEILSRYCKGVLWRKPLVDTNIPRLYLTEEVKVVHEKIEWLNQCINEIEEEVRRYA